MRDNEVTITANEYQRLVRENECIKRWYDATCQENGKLIMEIDKLKKKLAESMGGGE